MSSDRTVKFRLGDMLFEYDEQKNQHNIQKHGISLKNAALVFFDYDRIELYDEENSQEEDRFDVIGDAAAGVATIGNFRETSEGQNDILFVVYTERESIHEGGESIEVTRIISARYATNFERGMYYGKLN